MVFNLWANPQAQQTQGSP